MYDEQLKEELQAIIDASESVNPSATRIELKLQDDAVLAINDNIVLEFVAGGDSSDQRLIIHDNGETFAIADFRNIYRKGSEGKLELA